MSNETRQLVLNTISRLDNADKTQIEINQLWLEIKTLFINEMDSLTQFNFELNFRFKLLWHRHIHQAT